MTVRFGDFHHSSPFSHRSLARLVVGDAPHWPLAKIGFDRKEMPFASFANRIPAFLPLAHGIPFRLVPRIELCRDRYLFIRSPIVHFCLISNQFPQRAQTCVIFSCVFALFAFRILFFCQLHFNVAPVNSSISKAIRQFLTNLVQILASNFAERNTQNTKTQIENNICFLTGRRLPRKRQASFMA